MLEPSLVLQSADFLGALSAEDPCHLEIDWGMKAKYQWLISPDIIVLKHKGVAAHCKPWEHGPYS